MLNLKESKPELTTKQEEKRSSWSTQINQNKTKTQTKIPTKRDKHPHKVGQNPRENSKKRQNNKNVKNQEPYHNGEPLKPPFVGRKEKLKGKLIFCVLLY